MSHLDETVATFVRMNGNLMSLVALGSKLAWSE